MTARSMPPEPPQDSEVHETQVQDGPTKDAQPAVPPSAPDQAQALQSYARLREVVEGYRSENLSGEDQLARVKSRIMDIVEAELARGPSTDLVTPNGRDYAMALAALRSQVREALDEEPGVHARRVHILEVEAATMSIDLQVTMTVSSRSSIPELQDRLRTRITEKLRGAVSLHARTIDLIAEDIYDE